MDNCIFCKIVKGELPSYKVWEDEDHLAFLSIMPIKEGHTLVIPKKHEDYIFDLEDQNLEKLIIASKKVSQILKKAFKPKLNKIGVIVYGADIPHTHIHLAPMDKSGELNFAKQKPASEESLQKVLAKIKAA
jgi:histidine triad (HIT) family protein